MRQKSAEQIKLFRDLITSLQLLLGNQLNAPVMENTIEGLRKEGKLLTLNGVVAEGVGRLNWPVQSRNDFVICLFTKLASQKTMMQLPEKVNMIVG